MYSLGIDIGYASVKVVLVDGEGEVRYQRYQLHKGDAKGWFAGLWLICRKMALCPR